MDDLVSGWDSSLPYIVQNRVCARLFSMFPLTMMGKEYVYRLNFQLLAVIEIDGEPFTPHLSLSFPSSVVIVCSLALRLQVIAILLRSDELASAPAKISHKIGVIEWCSSKRAE